MARPLDYKTPEELQKAIDQYFDACEGKLLTDDEGNVLTDKKGRPIVIGAKPPTVTGLALALGFNSRQALLNYQVKKRFNDTVTRAKSRCEEYAESRLYDRDGSRGAEFSLKYNFHWEDQKDKGRNEIENNIFDVINESTRKEIDTSAIPEIESPAESGDDLVE